ncbi:hypothetical protein COCSUDRAFT_67376 [Coccomyxa subellipsoidea C-169]|uniref:Uncharacterized protein n=1 Tax=Coccomyxa subellipsoidea (strain C-169) TaxID=574566 RepID=I0YPZ6_COCSC|nr:hypothetical protein COCSUDRAFT_67376 [Coccomyxa subellipsoidea C-169]EIE20465.1 hypothetical protein COCSUDRAFT_67376 [Coccomyxa subellipsoidea C-169]|eukprot:XP_005645009.1 hypothetical protein COCSUDRAFT_67376 [Coccomyxa subellipsoidea C-169]
MPERVAQLPETLWPTTKAFVSLIDGLHSYTGLPWWATLSLTAVGVRAALLPVSVQQMRASAALWSTWRQAQQSAAQRSASQQTHSSFGSRAPGPYSSAAASSLSSKTPGLTRPAAAQAEGTQLHGMAAQAALNQARLLSDQDAHAAGPSGSRKVEGGRPKQEETRQAKGESGGAHRGGALWVDAEGGSAANRQQDDEGDDKGADGQAKNRGDSAGLRQISVADTLAEYWRLRARSGAPHPAWIATVFGTSVFAARAMAASDWPGFASGGALWFPDLTKASVVIHWGQDALSTAVAFPYGQLGAVLPIAVALALFANINMSFGRSAPVSPSDPKGEGAVAAYVMGAARAVLEWVTVPVLAIALGLPHGALVYWLSSSTFSLGQGVALQRPEIRELLGLPSPRRNSEPLKSWGAQSTPGSTSAQPDISQLFLQAAEARARGDVAAALALVGRIQRVDPTHPRAHFAAAQLHAELKQWAESEAAYVSATSLETDLAQRARAWFGAGVAQHSQGDLDAALQAFARASSDALEAADTLSASPSPNSMSNSSSAPDTAGPAPADMAGAESSDGDDVAERVILARRTAVRALLAQAGTLKQLGRLPEALEAAQRAVDFDESVRRVHVAPLEAEIAAARTQP